MYTFQDYYIPSRMMGGIERYISDGIPPGDFLTSIITNDLSGAVGAADDENLRNLPAYVAYFYNEVPSGCWGSREIFDNWMENKMLEAQAMNDAGKSA